MARFQDGGSEKHKGTQKSEGAYWAAKLMNRALGAIGRGRR